jgi:uncharacterized protein YdeI (YjbR/CyaY-like superfamily)
LSHGAAGVEELPPGDDGRPRILPADRASWRALLAGTHDEQRSMRLLTPRKPGSGWSGANKVRIERLEAAGLMTPAGRARIDAARADGSWTTLDEVEALTVPDDLAAAFAEHPGSAQQWEGFPRSARRAILEWIVHAKRPETRARRVAETAEKAAHGERANQWIPPDRR